MSALKITFVLPDGTERTVEGKIGKTLMEVAKANDIDGIWADCGGGCACATCHVYVDAPWMEKVGKPDDIETVTLDMVQDVLQPTSRLSCQIHLSPELDGLRVTVAPAS